MLDLIKAVLELLGQAISTWLGFEYGKSKQTQAQDAEVKKTLDAKQKAEQDVAGTSPDDKLDWLLMRDDADRK